MSRANPKNVMPSPTNLENQLKSLVECALVFAERIKRFAETQITLDVFAVEGHDAQTVGESLVQFVGHEIDGGPVVEKDGVVGLESDGLRVELDGLGKVFGLIALVAPLLELLRFRRHSLGSFWEK